MRIPTRLLVLPLLLAYPARASLSAQAARDNAQTDITPSVRWNRLVPGIVDETMASEPRAPPRSTPATQRRSAESRRRHRPSSFACIRSSASRSTRL